MSYVATEEQKRLREELRDAALALAKAYEEEEGPDGTMPLFHFTLGSIAGLTTQLMHANRDQELAR